MKRHLIVISFFILAGMTWLVAPVHAAGDHRLFTELLLDHVEFGLVDYEALCVDPRLDQYLQNLQATDPSKIDSRPSQIAFWINAYNAFTLQAVCEEYPIGSINELHSGGMILGNLFKRTVWDRPFIVINGKKMTLGIIEHKILREKYQEPRIHFALVCAAVSCPALRYEAYEGEKIDAQLDDQARIFLRDSNKNSFDRPGHTAYLSAIFAWFAGDFGGRENLLNYVVQFLPDDLAEDIRARRDVWSIRHKHYDWSLNDSRLGK